MATGRRLSYWNARLLRTVFLQLHQQKEEGLFCDVTLQGDGDGDGLHVHACVIAACSPYLAELLRCPAEISDTKDNSGGSVLCKKRILKVSGIPNHYLLPIVRYMYTSELEVAASDAIGVLKTAQKLKIPVLESLRLEGGRIVRPETGRKLNRGCLGSGKQTYVVDGPQDTEIELIKKEVITNDDKSFVVDSVNNELHSSEMLENIVSTQCLGETIPNKQNVLGSVITDTPHNVRLKRLYNSPEGLPNQSSLGTVSTQTQSSPEILVDHVKKDETANQEIHDTPENVNSKKRKLIRGVKLDISPNMAKSMSPSGKLTDKTTHDNSRRMHRSASLTSTFTVRDGSKVSELSNVQCDVFHMKEDTKVMLKGTKSAVPSSWGQLCTNIPDWEESGESYGSQAWENKSFANEDENFGIADSSVGNFGPCIGLEGLSKTESELTEIQKDMFTENDLMHACFSNFEGSMTCVPSSTVDELGTIQPCTNVPSVHEVEKVKLRKINNGLRWEIVKDMLPDTVSTIENAEHITDLELLEQALSPLFDVDVGGCSPVGWNGESIWPDLSTESDEEIDVLM